jgi:flagellar motor protein MotB
MIMFKKISSIALSLSLLLVFSCVSKNKYVELETRTNATQAQLEEDKKSLQAQNNKLLSENNRLLDTIEGLKLELRQEKMTVQKKENEVSELDRTRREIEISLKEQIAQKDIKLEEIEGKLKITFVDKILFDSGSVTVKPKGQEVLLKLAESFNIRMMFKSDQHCWIDFQQTGNCLQQEQLQSSGFCRKKEMSHQKD